MTIYKVRTTVYKDNSKEETEFLFPNLEAAKAYFEIEKGHLENGAIRIMELEPTLESQYFIEVCTLDYYDTWRR